MTSVAPYSDSTRSAPALELTSAGERVGHRQRFAALDGIRAFAVMAVLLYHFGISWVGGGLLGVDVFFVLSGFLITTLLCRELTRSGTVRLARFWAQRARRLLPALFVLLLGVAGYAYFFAGSIDVGSVRGDALSTLFYVANWHFILSDQGYFQQAAAPSPLLHTWSLAVEEQYYLLWPLIALLVVKVWGVAKLAVVAAIGAVASSMLMLGLYLAGSSIDRLYYGTDTRAQALLVGSFLGAVGSHRGDNFVILPSRWTDSARQQRWWAVPGLVGAAFLIWAWHALSGPDPFLYHGGFLLVAVAAGAVILTCVTAPASLLPRVCSFSVLVFIGRISYGVYLYHWPLFLVINHAHTGLSGFWLLVVRLAATFAIAAVSFRFLEEPIRTHQFFRGRKGLISAGVAAVVTAMVILVATLASTTAAALPAPGSGLSISEHQSLVAAGAFTNHPIRFAIVGDSIGLTLGVGLSIKSNPGYGIQLIDGGTLGCDLDNVPVKLSGVVGPPTEGCQNWRETWRTGIDRVRPDVVGMLIGRWEVSDHLWQGKWVHVGDAAWDDHLTAELNQAIDIVSSTGARVVLFTMPYVDPPVEAANGSTFSENESSRAAAFNHLLARVATERSTKVTLVDLNKMLDPEGQYQAKVDGITVRWSDGIHITEAGGEWLQPRILPLVDRLGLEARASEGTVTPSR